MTLDDVVIARTESIYETIKSIGPDPYSFIQFVTFIGNLMHLQPIFTEEGLCYTFNALNSREIFTDEYAINLPFLHNLSFESEINKIFLIQNRS